MRENKFRVWDIETKQFFYWKITENYPTCLTKEYVEKNLQQYTGLKDKNDKEIYEGDIVRLVYRDGRIIISEVKWDSYSDGEYVDNIECWMIENNSLSELLTYRETYGHDKLRECEIIGNIYENPELLK